MPRLSFLLLLLLFVSLILAGQGLAAGAERFDPAQAEMSVAGNSIASDKAAIKWQVFGSAVFSLAKRENKLVLLDLEAVWCHWCHVMAETTYKDPAVVKILQSKYLTVRVDQDSRPDLSNKYEQYGWPATIIFDADGRELVKQSGYVEPETMRRLLKDTIARAAKIDSTPLRAAAAPTAPTASAPATALTVPSGLAAPPGKSDYIGLAPADKEILIKKHNDGYDTKNGGWGSYQKFLDFDSVEYGLSRALCGDKQEKDRVCAALDGELNLLDPAFGGLYQYSTDGDWQHPHFEKVMAIQTEAIRLYCQAYLFYKDQKYLDAARKIEHFLSEFLSSDEGAFYTSQDADLKPGEHSADYFKLGRDERLKIGQPRVDQHIYSRENGLAINALTYLYRATGDKKYLDRALKAATWIESNRALEQERTGGFRHDSIDKAGPYLGDNLAMGRAYLSLYEVTAEKVWLNKARSCGDFIERHFVVDSQAGFVTTVWSSWLTPPTGGRAAGAQERMAAFAPIALLDENATLSRFYNLLYRYTGVDHYRQSALRALAFLSQPSTFNQRRIFVGGILLADDENHTNPLHVTVSGGKTEVEAADLFAQAIALPQIYKRVEWFDRREGPLANSDVELPQLPHAAAFACGDGRCSRPAYTADELVKMVQRLAGSN